MNAISIFITMILLFVFGSIFDYLRSKKVDTSLRMILIKVVLSFVFSLAILSLT